MEELKPCPFCGGVVSVQSIEPRIYKPSMKYLAVICYGCDLLFGYDTDYGGIFSSETEAVKAWNRRANDE